MHALTSWLGKKAAPLPRPAQPICLIGDIHGRIDLLDAMLKRIAQEPNANQARIIILGDMVDRGPHSAAVLQRLYAMQTAESDRIICLMGNHERMMLDFMTSPDTAESWLRFGGRETAASYGLNIEDAPERLALALSDAIPPHIMQWLARLPLSWCADGLLAVHAAADPRLPATSQPERALLWGHRDFGRRARKDGLWVACGHVVVPEPVAAKGRISLDTGAWTTGTLSAGWLDQDGLRFLQVSSSSAQ